MLVLSIFSQPKNAEMSSQDLDLFFLPPAQGPSAPELQAMPSHPEALAVSLVCLGRDQACGKDLPGPSQYNPWLPWPSPKVPTPGSQAGAPGAAEPSWRLSVGPTTGPGVQINRVGQRSLRPGEWRLVKLPSWARWGTGCLWKAKQDNFLGRPPRAGK